MPIDTSIVPLAKQVRFCGVRRVGNRQRKWPVMADNVEIPNWPIMADILLITVKQIITNSRNNLGIMPGKSQFYYYVLAEAMGPTPLPL